MLKHLTSNSLALTLTRHWRYRFGLLKFNLPDLGQKIKQGTIKKLYVKEGDKVKQFQKLADVASDKQFTEITASDAGVIRKIHYKEEDVCQVGALLLEIELPDSKPDSHQQIEVPTSPKTAQKAKPQKQQTSDKDSSTQNTILATPYVRNLIKQRKLDINSIRGSGPDGRILQSDLDKASSPKKQPTKTTPPPPQAQPQKTQKPQPQSQSQSHPSPSTQTSTTIKMNNFQKGMQKSMTQSNKIPHLYLHQEFDITQTEKMRKTIKKNQVKVTLMGILIKTFSLALKKYPIMNSTYQPDKNQFEYTIQSNHNISIAIDSNNGLVVPNIKSVQNCNLTTIQQQLQKLRKLATQGKLTSKQLTQGTVCLSNIGTIGGTNACPLILPPQVCIVAIGKMQVLPRYVGDQLVPRTLLTVSYGCDHRVIDGATVARFSNEWKKILESPYLALAEMS